MTGSAGTANASFGRKTQKSAKERQHNLIFMVTSTQPTTIAGRIIPPFSAKNRENSPFQKMVGWQGLEPWTNALKGHCSTN
jgi:hypothetical protein